MTTPPEFSEEEWMRQQAAGPLTPGREDLGEREAGEHAREEAEAEYLDSADNEAHAPGATCELCGGVITASQDARRLRDGNWVHEACPLDGGLPTAGA